MKIGVLQLNPVVGDLHGNAAMIHKAVLGAAADGADFCVTPELALTGYPPRDLLLYDTFVHKARAMADTLARDLADSIPLLLGGVEPNPGQGKPVFNCALWCQGGEVCHTFRKTLLPTYDVFDEARYFEPAPTGSPRANILEFSGRTMAVTICEDAWNDKDYWDRRTYNRDPLEEAAAHNPDFIVNLSASPLFLDKQSLREDMLGAVAKKYAIPLIYANQLGGNDDLVFDGRSCAFSSGGTLMARADSFKEDTLIVDLDGQNTIREDTPSREAETWEALVLATGDYARKSGFTKALVGLSGGIDSAVTMAVAARALGRDNVLGVLMPSPYSSQGSIDDSLALAEQLGTKTLTLPIEPIMQTFTSTLAAPFDGLPMDTTEENIQSRIRGNLLMALSNKYRSLLLTTGNKSELAVGYCTIYGDMSGGYAVISDLDKTSVFNLARWINDNLDEHIRIPEAIITKPPSAELRPDQKDQDSLPPYDILDAILALHVEHHQSTDQIVDAGFDRETVEKVLNLVRFAEFKRRQAAPGIKLTPRSFGTGWRMPLACKREL